MNENNSLKNKQKTFKLDKVETARYQKFIQNHRNCQFDENNRSKFGAIGGGFSVTFKLSGEGNIIVCKCEGCNESANITNFDKLN